MRRLVFLLLLALGAPAGIGPSVAWAQSGDTALAESLFLAGRELMKEGNYEEACPKFEESNRIDPSAGTLLNLGQCHEKLGRTASAWAAYKKAITVGRANNQLNHVDAAKEFVDAIEPKLSRLTIEAPPIEGLTIRRGDLILSGAAVGVAVVLDPGTYEIEAKAPGRETYTTEVTIGLDADEQTITIPELEISDEPLPPPVVPGPPSPNPVPQPDPPGPQEPGTDEGGFPFATVGWVVGGVGVVGVGVGAIFGLLTLDDASVAESDDGFCPNKECSEEGLDLIESAETRALISNLGFGIGAGLIATGVVLILVDPGDGGGDASVGIAPTPSGLLLRGTF